jgi:hypothetical protein
VGEEGAEGDADQEEAENVSEDGGAAAGHIRDRAHPEHLLGEGEVADEGGEEVGEEEGGLGI